VIDDLLIYYVMYITHIWYTPFSALLALPNLIAGHPSRPGVPIMGCAITSTLLMVTGLVSGKWANIDHLQNRHPSPKIVTVHYVVDPYICAEFGANPSTGAFAQMGEL